MMPTRKALRIYRKILLTVLLFLMCIGEGFAVEERHPSIALPDEKSFMQCKWGDSVTDVKKNFPQLSHTWSRGIKKMTAGFDMIAKCESLTRRYPYSFFGISCIFYDYRLGSVVFYGKR